MFDILPVLLVSEEEAIATVNGMKGSFGVTLRKPHISVWTYMSGLHV